MTATATLVAAAGWAKETAAGSVLVTVEEAVVAVMVLEGEKTVA